MKIAFSTIACPDYDWTDIYPMAADLGFDGIEIRGLGQAFQAPYARSFSPAQRARTKATLDRLGLEIPCFSSGCELYKKDDREANVAEVNDIFHPFAVDVSGSLEVNREKSAARIAAFMEQVHEINRRN